MVDAGGAVLAGARVAQRRAALADGATRGGPRALQGDGHAARSRGPGQHLDVKKAAREARVQRQVVGQP